MKIQMNKVQDKALVACEALDVTTPCILAIDAASACTGVCIFDIEANEPLYTMSFMPDTKVDRASIRFKIELKRFIFETLKAQSNIKYIVYEQPFLRTFNVAMSLLPLSQIIDEIVIEHEPSFDTIPYEQLENKSWKKALFGKLPKSNSEQEKKMVKEHICNLFPYYETLTQDECDACGLAVVKNKMLSGEVTIEKKKKVHPFKYELAFIQANDLETCTNVELPKLNIPDKVIKNGILTTSIRKGQDIKPKIYKTMTSDDKVVIIEVKAKSAGMLMVEHGIPKLTTEYLYIIAWRKNRKTNTEVKKSHG